MQPKPDDGHWRLRPDVVCTVLNDGAVVLDLRSKYFYSANATAWAILQMFETGATLAEVRAARQRWAGHKDAPAVDEVLNQIFAEDLVEPAEAPATAPPEAAVSAWVPPMLCKNHEPLQRIMVSAFDPGLPLAE